MKLAVAPLVLSTATFGLMLGVSQNAQAAGLIRNVTASTNISTASGWDIQNTTNGRGLQGPPLNQPTLTGTHASSAGSNAWRSNSSTYTGNIEFNLNKIYNLAGFSFWNLGGGAQTTLQGIKNVTIQYKLGTAGAWTTLTGAPTSFAKGASSGSVAVENFNFAPVYATHVRFSNMTNWGSTGTFNRLGFSEIQFTSIPEPSSTLALLALGLAGVGLRKRV